MPKEEYKKLKTAASRNESLLIKLVKGLEDIKSSKIGEIKFSKK